MNVLLGIPPVLFLGCILAGCGSVELASHWRAEGAALNGRVAGWAPLLTSTGSTGTSVGVQNDGEYIYVGLVSTDHSVQNQIIHRGMTVWIDNRGEKEKRFGIHYPVVYNGRGAAPEGAGADHGDFAARSNVQGPDAELEILGPGDEHTRMTKAQTGGIDAMYRIVNDTLVYELRVPLSESVRHPFAINAMSGTLVAVGFETPAPRVEKPSERGESDQNPGEGTGDGMGEGRGMGARGGRHGGGPYGRGRPRDSSDGQPMNFWTHVHLVAQDSVSHQDGDSSSQ